MLRHLRGERAAGGHRAAAASRPAEAAQVDFGAGPLLTQPAGKPRRTWAFVMTLCFSRHQYVEFVWDQTRGHLARLSPPRLRVVRRACRARSSSTTPSAPSPAPVATTRWCSAPTPSAPKATASRSTPARRMIRRRRASSKPASSTSRATSCPCARSATSPISTPRHTPGCMEEAGIRMPRHHARAAAGPVRAGAAAAAALPAIAPDLGTWHRVVLHRDCHVQFERASTRCPSRWSARRLWLRATDGAVTLYDDYRLVATHLRAQRPGQRATPCAIICRRRRGTSSPTTATGAPSQARRVGPRCAELSTRLLARSHPRAAARGPRRPAPARALRRARDWKPPAPRALAHDSAALPHRQDDPGRRLRPAAVTAPRTRRDLQSGALCPQRGQPVRRQPNTLH